jgi:hypothetical protein
MAVSQHSWTPHHQARCAVAHSISSAACTPICQPSAREQDLAKLYSPVVAAGCRLEAGATTEAELNTASPGYPVTVGKVAMMKEFAVPLCVAGSNVAGVTPYHCDGPGCCEFTCPDPTGCRARIDRMHVPHWWPQDSCGSLVSRSYDPFILCSQAKLPYDPCGEDEHHACGYGLACGAAP